MDREIDRIIPRRRTVLKAIGATSAISFTSGIAGADEKGEEEEEEEKEEEEEEEEEEEKEEEEEEEDESTAEAAGCEQEDCIHPFSGFPILPDNIDATEQPEEATHTVTAHVEESEGPPGCGDFHFNPAGLHVQPEETVLFEPRDDPEHNAVAGDHTVTAYSEVFDRQRRIPEDATPFSSPMVGPDVAWLYQFNEPGVYDIYCGPHEGLGMVMRIVVGDKTTTDFGPTGEPTEEDPDPTPLGPLGAANNVLANLDPTKIKNKGTIPWSDDLCNPPE